MDRVDLLNRIAELEKELRNWRIDSRDCGVRVCNSRRFHLGTQYPQEAPDELLGLFLVHLEGVLDASDPQGVLF